MSNTTNHKHGSETMNLGERIYYTGDAANHNAAGTIVAIYPATKYGPKQYEIDFDVDPGEEARNTTVTETAFLTGPGRRFWMLDEWHENRRQRIAESMGAIEAAAARFREKHA